MLIGIFVYISFHNFKVPFPKYLATINISLSDYKTRSIIIFLLGYVGPSDTSFPSQYTEPSDHDPIEVSQN